MNRLAAYPLVYLATPYTRYPAGPEAAFRDACRLAAKLLTAGVKVYSPIAHTHPIAVHGNLDPLDHGIWLPFDEAMMAASATLLVAQLEGWRESFGVTFEINFFKTWLKPVFYLDKDLMHVGETPWEFD